MEERFYEISRRAYDILIEQCVKTVHCSVTMRKESCERLVGFANTDFIILVNKEKAGFNAEWMLNRFTPTIGEYILICNLSLLLSKDNQELTFEEKIERYMKDDDTEIDMGSISKISISEKDYFMIYKLTSNVDFGSLFSDVIEIKKQVLISLKEHIETEYTEINDLVIYLKTQLPDHVILKRPLLIEPKELTLPILLGVITEKW